MADSFVQLNLGAGGDKADAETLTVGANTVKRERDQIAGKGATEIAEVKAADPTSDMNGLVVRNIPSGTQAVSAVSLPLPTGAATETTLATRAGEHTTAVSPHAARLSDGAAFYKATTPADTQPISVATLPLPTGAATEATLATRASEHTTAASPHAARLSDGAAFYKATTPTDTQPVSAVSLPLPTGAATEATLATRASAANQTNGTQTTRITDGTDTANVTASGGLQVDGSSVTQPVSAVSLPLPTGAATEATLATRAAGTQLPAALVGGRLDENVGAWLGSTAPTVGQKTAANSVPVVLSSDYTPPLPTSPGTATTFTVADSATVVTIVAANAARKGLAIQNAVSLSPLYLKFGSGASTTDYHYLVQAGQTYEMPPSYYAGIVTGIWLAAGFGNAVSAEIT